MKPSVSWLNHQKDKLVVVEEFLSDFLLAEIYSPLVLSSLKKEWDSLPFYVKKTIPVAILDVVHSSGMMPDNVQEKINQYWFNRAITVLEGYQNCPTPLTKDVRIMGPCRNLLSQKGEVRLLILKQAAKSQKISDVLLKQAIQSSHKFLLDLDLFINFEQVNAIPHNIKYEGSGSGSAVDMQVSMTSGCYNGCVHCGYEATAPVYHMPYPIFLKLMRVVHPKGNPRFPILLYSDSDPITYHDPIINADSGDVMLALKKQFSEKVNISFLTKGVLTKQDDISLAKVVYHTKDDENINLLFSFSFVDLPGEKINKNVIRLKKTQHIYNSVTQRKMEIRHYFVPDKEVITSELLSQFGEVRDVTGLDPVGRWAKGIQEISLFAKNEKKQSDIRHFSKNRYIIAADLTLYDVYQKGLQFNWLPLCSILDVPSMSRLIVPQKMHPTVFGDGYKRGLKEGFFTRLLGRFLGD